MFSSQLHKTQIYWHLIIRANLEKIINNLQRVYKECYRQKLTEPNRQNCSSCSQHAHSNERANHTHVGLKEDGRSPAEGSGVIVRIPPAMPNMAGPRNRPRSRRFSIAGPHHERVRTIISTDELYREKIMWERSLPKRIIISLFPPRADRSVESIPSRADLQLLSIICRRGCR